MSGKMRVIWLYTCLSLWLANMGVFVWFWPSFNPTWFPWLFASFCLSLGMQFLVIWRYWRIERMIAALARQWLDPRTDRGSRPMTLRTCPVCGAEAEPGEGPYEWRGDVVLKDWQCTRCAAFWMAVFVWHHHEDVEADETNPPAL
jgi:hypothetical protein